MTSEQAKDYGEPWNGEFTGDIVFQGDRSTHRTKVAQVMPLAWQPSDGPLVDLITRDEVPMFRDRIIAAVNACSGVPSSALKPEMVKKMIDCLQEIEKGEGAYNRDPLEHASNTIDSMKEIARSLLKELEAP